MRYQGLRPVRTNAERDRLVLQTLGRFDAKQLTSSGRIRETMSAFFGLPVEVAPPLALAQKGQRRLAPLDAR